MSERPPEITPPAIEFSASDPMPPETLPLIAYRTSAIGMTLAAGAGERDWMDMTSQRFAYRCMPMLLANQNGWLIRSSHHISVTWDGGGTVGALRIDNHGGTGACPALSVFGSGILTFSIPFLFRTPEGYNLLVQGPANWPKDGISALSGIVETDWAEATFTMNWKLTRAQHTVSFAIGEPIAMIIPQRRYDCEQFDPKLRDIASNPSLHADYLAWSQSRRQFNQDLKLVGSEAQKSKWQKHYAQGKTVSGKRSQAHQSKIKLPEFKAD